MTYAAPQLAALVAVCDTGTFEAAARTLHVTPSAVSQRVRALESEVGQVLVRRATPCTPTDAGAVLVRLGRAQALLAAEARAELGLDPEDAGGAAGPYLDLGVAVNADSLATWFREVLAIVAQWPGVALGLHVEDQAWSHDLLREGRVLGAVTSDPVAVQGCRAEPLGTLRYRPAAAPALVGQGEAARPDWSGLPMVVFNDKDALQDQWLARRGAVPPRVVHRVPTSADFVAAIEAGLGWGMVPEPQLVPALRAGALVALAGEEHLDVWLHWQRWRLGSEVLDRLSDAVRGAARRHLRA